MTKHVEEILMDIIKIDPEPFYEDEKKVRDATLDLVRNRIFHFQWWMFGATGREGEHIAQLINWFTPPPGGRCLDIGCGVGSDAFSINKLYHSPLQFTLMNISQFQLDTIDDETGIKIRHDARSIPYPFGDDFYDSIMVLYTLGHCSPIEPFLKECYRILAPNGILFIWDMISESPMKLAEDIGYITHRPEYVLEVADRVGFHIARAGQPFPVTFNKKAYDPAIFIPKYQVSPVAYTFIK